MSKQQIGVIGLAVMGKNLALNIESRGFSVSVYNRSSSKTEEFLQEAKGKNVVGTYSIEEFVQSLETPRKILLMVKAGTATDATIQSLLPHLEKDDILIDGGNTYYKDTQRRNKELAESGIHFIGTGVSGGEEGALKGPSIMPGGQKEAHELVKPILEAISAKVDGEPCTTYIGPDGAGHYVKMVHNGIEYGDMQLISESYFILKQVLGLSADELHEVFAEWNKGELDSYLIEITADIFTKKDEETGKPLVDVILDKAGQKGTGKWTSQSALDLGVPLPIITESVFARFISAMKEERVKASGLLSGPEVKPVTENKEELIEAVRKALFMSKICSYAQGFAQMKAASEEYNWDLKYGEIAMIFRGGCIIRAAFLQKIKEAYDREPELDNLLLDSYFKNIVESYQGALRQVISLAVAQGVPVPSFSSALAYYDSYRTAVLPANLIQAQRDYFGAHTYERTDKEGIFHTEWMK
ncbi:NADP-dependent phosphogluconate dehydrogenase [Bacillus subtilis]|jgi:6-phosphogluconate dehydrogenase|uniref:6-phosphogluconate dehydrogenase, NADP(+)-dependent, decarboxylating n=9 Tax=Bacillus TaxID=1386 RepID=6PGD_BACSU|nr:MULTISPECIES: NADP-dependent phosphogluconate dehydrogenase [Bacillales]NP_390267.2 NADP+-dependent 6-P-gluconate dehydrogenase [Bacillus subtilis subsp. subtilis str. 168]P80859.4 RecName: Full=6-phosphogluconate dehydrogenase, NADP(+)-dependent, decarboxylating; AltName: Full=GNTZII [Bacillus subtilis subsp. subtilis str. 168]AOL30142.1 phosphogluconate dehydrogenase (NADP(+)-dependent, decarboxylating) [Alkalicoccobacillus gibsonii]AUZ26991.1 phosphogluconate dehydrogenase (NADP(+)-depend